MDKSGKWLVMTEKPSVAGDIAKALGDFEKKGEYYESDEFVITWAVGHLLELLSPEEIDPKYKSWLLKDLPIIPEGFKYKPKDGQKGRLDTIKTLAKRSNVRGFVNACDAGREGELIFREVHDFCDVSKPVQRLWLQSMTKEAIRKEFQALRDGHDFDHLGDAARCRAESDWLIGMNATRAVTKRLKARNERGSWSVGRVQTPTLALLVRRELEILQHRPEPFWTIEGRFSTDTHEYSGQWFDPNFKRQESGDDEDSDAQKEKEDRIFSKEKLAKILEELEAHRGRATASEIRKESKEIAPQLFDLTMLQREANRRFGMSANRTLQAAQRLYERHKVITYPRTDSKYLPDDYREPVRQILKTFGDSGHEVSSFCLKILKNGLLNEGRIFNNKFVSDHFAIIPTGELPSALEGDDARIFTLILKRFLAAFMPHAIWAKVERITRIADHSFRTRVQDLQEPGWRAVYGLDTEEESKLPKLDPNNPQAKVPVTTEAIDPAENATKPLPRFTEARLLSLMEHCGRTVVDEEIADALKEKGIGTPATRAEVIENLISKEYIVRMGKTLRASAKGVRLIDVLSRVPVAGLASVELTGEMEYDLKRMEKGLKSRAEFMSEMIDFTKNIVEKTRSFDYNDIYASDPPLGKCPACATGNVIESFWAYKCTNGNSGSKKNTEQKPDACEFIIWKMKNQRYIDRSLVRDVLRDGKAGPVEFLTNAGTSYSATVAVTKKGLVLLDENGEYLEQPSGSEAKIVHEEHVESTFLGVPARLVETEVAYICEFAEGAKAPDPAALPVAQADGEKAKGKGAKSPAAGKRRAAPKKVVARMPKNLCSRKMSLEEFRSYILTGATPAITDFKSKKGRPFAASLHLKGNGGFEFKFVPRKKANAADGGASAADGSTVNAVAAGAEGDGTNVGKPVKRASNKAKVVKKGSG